jgi:ATP-dependent Lon protease
MKILLLHLPLTRRSYLSHFTLSEPLAEVFLAPVLEGRHELRLVDLRVTPDLERELGKLLRKTATRIASAAAAAPIAIDLDAVRDALGRQRFFREAAERTAVPGVATGLAVTGVGGDVLFVEATSVAGGEKLVLTGQLGDVMKESAQIALSFVRSNANELGVLPGAFEHRKFHHCAVRQSEAV